jgi:type IV pilus assembly protein PilM
VARSTKHQRPVVGLDIEPGAVAAAMVETEGSLSITTIASAPLAPNVVRDGEVADAEALVETLKQLFSEHSLDRRVRIGVANQRIVVRTIEVPPVDDPKDFAAIVRFQAESELPMQIDEAVIDFQALDLVETPQGPRRRVVLVAARREMVEEFVSAVRAAGLRPEGIDLSAFAMVRALDDGDEKPALFMSIGGLTNLAIAQEGTVRFTRVSGSGLEGMAALYAERRGVPVDEGREMLLQIGVDGPIEPGDEEEGGMARAIMIEGIRRIAGEARASLDFHHAAAPSDESVERAIVTGPVVAVPGFLDALAQELGLPITAGVVDGASSDLDGARYAVAAGLAVEEAVA